MVVGRPRLGSVGKQGRTLSGVHTLADALRLAQDGAGAHEGDLSDVAEGLEAAYSALDRARARVPTAAVTPRHPEGEDS